MSLAPKQSRRREGVRGHIQTIEGARHFIVRLEPKALLKPMTMVLFSIPRILVDV